MVAGLSFQVASLAIFIGLCGDFAWRVCKDRKSRPLELSQILPCSSFRFHTFLYSESHASIANYRSTPLTCYVPSALALATLCIFIRSCFRVAELRGGFNGALANQQVTFMILEGAMIVIACIALTMAHPGLVFGKAYKAVKTNTSGNEVDLVGAERTTSVAKPA